MISTRLKWKRVNKLRLMQLSWKSVDKLFRKLLKESKITPLLLKSVFKTSLMLELSLPKENLILLKTKKT